MILRYYLDSRQGQASVSHIREIVAKPLPTLVISAKQLVGTDLSQAVPLTFAAALGALIFGHVEFGVTVSLILGSVPAVLLGSLLSSSAPDRYIRPVITFVVFASGLKYVGLGARELGWILLPTLVIGLAGWGIARQTWLPRRAVTAKEPEGPQLESVLTRR